MLLDQPLLNLQAVEYLYTNIDISFAKKLIQQNNFTFHNLPTQEDVKEAFESCEKQMNQKRAIWSSGQEYLLSVVVFGTCLKQKIFPNSLSTSDWEYISQLFENHNWKACRNKWLSSKYVKAGWTREEDRMLVQLYDQYPNKWCNIAIELWKKCQTTHIRLGKQCRDRWINKLDPNIIKLPWRREEELKLFYEVQKRGKRWATISFKAFQLKRTENQIKNRFYNLMKQEENKLQLSQMTFEDKEATLIHSIIEQLSNDIVINPSNRKQEDTYFEQESSNRMKIKPFSSYCRKDAMLVMIRGKKMMKLNDDK